VKLHELEAMRRSLAMSPSLSTGEIMRLINTWRRRCPSGAARRSSGIGENREPTPPEDRSGSGSADTDGERFEPTMSSLGEALPAGPEGDDVKYSASARDGAGRGDVEPEAGETTGLRAVVDRSHERIAAEQARVGELIDKYDDRQRR
jgi:hypothetical protein